MSLLCYDTGRMLLDILAAGVPLTELAERLEDNFSAKLLKHYLRGGMPNFARGNVILAMWTEATGRPESEAPTFTWESAYRIGENADRDAMRPKCAHCGQTLRGEARIQAWQQLQLHHGQYGDPGVVPSWLAPRAVQRTEFQGRSRVVRAEDDGRVRDLWKEEAP